MASPKLNRDFLGPIDWNDTSNPVVIEEGRQEREDFERDGCDTEDDFDEDNFEGDYNYDDLSYQD